LPFPSQQLLLRLKTCPLSAQQWDLPGSRRLPDSPGMHTPLPGCWTGCACMHLVLLQDECVLSCKVSGLGLSVQAAAQAAGVLGARPHVLARCVLLSVSGSCLHFTPQPHSPTSLAHLTPQPHPKTPLLTFTPPQRCKRMCTTMCYSPGCAAGATAACTTRGRRQQAVQQSGPWTGSACTSGTACSREWKHGQHSQSYASLGVFGL
jgi:hypothetical protein